MDRLTAPVHGIEREGPIGRAALRVSAWMERWFPDAFVFVLVAVVVSAVGALALGVSPAGVSEAFGDGFWDLIPFAMQMTLVVIGGHVVATSPPASRLIERLAALPRSGRGAVAFVALVAMLTSLLNWGISIIFAGLLARRIARREELGMDYRAAGAAAYLGIGGVWALGLSSSAAQLQANPGSIPASLMPVTGVIPFADTIFTWQSLTLAGTLVVVNVTIAFLSAPKARHARTAQAMGVGLEDAEPERFRPRRPAEWLEYSPVLTLLVVVLGVGWLAQEFTSTDPIVAISGLNTYNLLFLMLGMLLQWRPRAFVTAVGRAVPATAGVLLQFPFYAGIAGILTSAENAEGHTVAHAISTAFVQIATPGTFALVIGAYSALLGFFVPSGGGKWIVEAPYVMQSANDLQYNLGWTVQIYNAAEALPNLLNPFWMLPLLGLMRLRAKHIVGFTALQFAVNLPLVLGLLWLFGQTLPYEPPALP
ncbi:short-chain fatty acid transporter [Prauserella flavalba]|uniref:Short chain fatty acid transporter n=1 Tax=Prauserella flavalba TaxID=1477506 RepID=A0A318LAE4_9PSEU|nr:TIGR00366 family protein [Prauserella flavalba]PXY18585.1 Short chain fatty acid transporter [Prauserella flavalba]